MTNPDDPAFPLDGKWEGLSKREIFSAMAMQGLISNPDFKQAAVMNALRGNDPALTCAGVATTLADALIAALNKKEI